MTPHPLQGAPAGASVLVAGAGIMGAGIAQVAAQAGHPVRLFDVRAGAAARAKAGLGATLDTLVAKGKLGAAQARDVLARIEPVDTLAQAAGVALVVEAIVESLHAKRALFADLEAVVDDACVLASNTSSISITAIAQGLRHPARVVGLHFFNPVPLMKLVEVVSGLHTDVAVAEALFDLSKAWGKVPVHAKSTPGFIVNRIARPYYAEALALLQERAATPEQLDAALRGAGFRMGPCELMDLIGHDTNFAVTQSVYEANFFDKRYQPSLVQRGLVEGGWLGRKTGRGFYRYGDGAPAPAAVSPVVAHTVAESVAVHGAGPVADGLFDAVRRHAGRWLLDPDGVPERRPDTGWTGLAVDGARLMMTDGRTAGAVAAALGQADVAVFDRLFSMPAEPGTPLAFAATASLGPQRAAAWLAALGFVPLPMADAPGLVVARTVAMLINEAADAVQQGVCTEAGADAAMTLGVNHPAGPFEFLSRWSAPDIVALLDSLDHWYRGERYRASPWLRSRALRVVG